MASESKAIKMEEAETVEAVTHKLQDSQDLVQRYKDLFKQQRLSDIVLRVGDQRYYAHRFVLITASSVFEAMLSQSRWKEARQPEVFLMEEDECVPQFEQFLGYLYSGEAELSTVTVLPLLLLADKYEVSCLRRSCLNFMMEHIVQSPDTNRALTWYQYAQMTGQTELRDKCQGFILSNFDTVMEACDWPDMVLEELTSFLASSDMVLRSEADLWSHVETWMLLHVTNKDTLEDNLKEILPHIRFTMMAPKQLLCVEKSVLYKDFKQLFSDKVNQAFKRHSLALEDEELVIGDSPVCQMREEYRNYTSEDYMLSYKFSLPGYTTINKIDTRISLDCQAPRKFVASPKVKVDDQTLFSVYFFPRGYFTTLTIYGSYMGRQTNEVTLKVIRRRPDLEPMKVDVTLLLLGKKNDVRYSAFTHTWSTVFTKETHTLSVDKFLSVDKLMEENSPYIVDGALQGTIFLKVQDVGSHLVEAADKK